MSLKVGQKVLHEDRVATILEVEVRYFVSMDSAPNHQAFCYGAESTDPPIGYTEAVPIPDNATDEQIEALRRIVR